MGMPSDVTLPTCSAKQSGPEIMPNLPAGYIYSVLMCQELLA